MIPLYRLDGGGINIPWEVRDKLRRSYGLLRPLIRDVTWFLDILGSSLLDLLRTLNYPQLYWPLHVTRN